jgi:hypothetical protein
MILTRFVLISSVVFGVSTAGALDSQTGVTAVLPNGREIHPAGNWVPLAPYPFALAVRPDGMQIAAPSIGFPFAINVVDGPLQELPTVRRMPPGSENVPEIAGEIRDIFDNHLHAVEYAVRAADPRVFIATKARSAKPKTKQEAAALHDVDNADKIRRAMEASSTFLSRPRE